MPNSLLQTQCAAPSPADAATLGQRLRAAKAMARGWAETLPEPERLETVRRFCAQMLRSWWSARAAAAGVNWPIARAPCATVLADPSARQVAQALGELAAQLEDLEAGYRLGTVYTAMLPAQLRSRWGSYYTPPAYVERLLAQAERAGFDFARGTAADPACGGGAFLAPLALRMWRASVHASAELVLADIARRLRGFELDPFAAWMSHVLLEGALLPLCVRAHRRMPRLVTVGDSLLIEDAQRFDLVAGNPPYGRVSLTPALRKRYARSLYGHANLYGLFTDLAVRLARPGGVVAFVTPTSFLGGQYFQNLRALLVREAPPVALDFIEARQGVFEDVLQEALLAVYVKGRACGAAQLATLLARPDASVQVREIGTAVPAAHGPWLLARNAQQARVLERSARLHHRLVDYGYAVSTGPLVWNRHRPQLLRAPAPGALPLIWAESVSPGAFAYSARRREHAGFIVPGPGQAHLVLEGEAVLVQRTTAKEQARRLVCAVIPQAFVDAHGGVVVENHLNVVKPAANPRVSPQALAAVLGSAALDAAFRCISGSVAVSAYELNALPLPGPREMAHIERMLASGSPAALIERRLARIYGTA